MTKRYLPFTILLTVGSWSVVQVGAQVPKEKQSTPAQTSSSTVKTRSRRQATSAETATHGASQVSDQTAKPREEKPQVEPASSDTPVKPAAATDSKPTKTPAADSEPSTATSTEVKTAKQPTDPMLDLRNQIQAATTSSERVPLQLKLVELMVNSGKRNEAIAELNRIVADDEFNPQGLYNAGNSFARLGETDGALNAYHKAIAQKNGQYSRAYNNLGVVLLRAGRWDEAYDAFLSALKLESFHYAEAGYNLGRLYAARGDNDLAIREWRRALTVDPRHTAAAQAIANIDNEGSIVISPAPVKAPKSSERRNSDRPLGATTKPVIKKSPAPTSSSKILAIDQTSYEFLQRARNSSERGKSQEAVANYRSVISRQGGYFPPANLELSYVLVSMKEYDDAQANLFQVATRDGDRYPVSYFHLARLYELKGDLTNAETFFGKAARVYGTRNSQFLLDLSRVREKQGNFKGALEAMEEYVTNMKNRGQELSWSDERLTALRQKLSPVTPK